MKNNQTQILEGGDIYFFYRPRVEEKKVSSFADIERFYMILHPQNKKKYRLIVLGEKKLPQISDGDRVNWGFIENVSDVPQGVEDELDKKEYGTKTRGERYREAARPAGEGKYAIADHKNHTHLVYDLELPETPKEVQNALNIEKEASYVISIKNPTKPTPTRVGLRPSEKAHYPSQLQNLFHERRFISTDVPDFLNYKDTEILLIGASENIAKELGIELHPEKEKEDTAEIFNDLKLEKNQHIIEPLFRGGWR